MDIPNELSKSRWFTIVNGTLEIAEQSAVLPIRADSLPAGLIDNKYQLLELVGQGGMGAVFRARHLALDKEVALKTFGTTQLSSESRLRFQREAQAIAKLNHKNVIQVFDYGLGADGVPYYTMEFLDGETLAERINKRGALGVPQAVELFLQVSDGLSAAHKKGIIHRDLKPANLFIERSTAENTGGDKIKIVDFGIACLTYQSDDQQRLTSSGGIFGSPLYMSPEQSAGAVVNARADIYSFGCSLFEALTGRAPFKGRNALETIMLHQSATPPRLQEGAGGNEFPTALESIVASMLAKRPEERPENMDQIAATLTRIKTMKHTSAQRRTSGQRIAPEPAITSQSTTTEAGGPPERNSGLKTGATVLGAILVLALVGFFVAPKLAPPKVHDTPQIPVQPAPEPTVVHSAEPKRDLIVHNSGRTFVQFTFDQYLELGNFSSRQFDFGESAAVGRIAWPLGVRPNFEPSAEFLEVPSHFDVFKPNDLLQVAITYADPVTSRSPLLYAAIGKLTGLESLTLRLSYGGEYSVNALKRLTKLRYLEIFDSDISARSLAGLPTLNQIEVLTFNNGGEVSALTAALKNNSTMTGLYLDKDKISKADAENIGTISNLNKLQFNGSHLNGDYLSQFTRLKKLRLLHVNDCLITGKNVDVLRTLVKNGLQELSCYAVGLSAKDRAEIGKILPGTVFFNPNAIGKDDVPSDVWQHFPREFDPKVK